MNFNGQFLLAFIGALSLGSALADVPNPTGNWNLKWSDNAYGVGFYQDDDQPQKGTKVVRPSDYHTQKVIDEFVAVQSLSVTYSDGGSTATVRGGGIEGDRLLTVSPLLSGEGWQADGNEPIGIVDLDPVDGCKSVLGEYERILVTSVGDLIYGRILAQGFDPSTCGSFFTSLVDHFDFSKSGTVLAVAYDSGAITLSKLPDLIEAQEVIIYGATRETG